MADGRISSSESFFFTSQSVFHPVVNEKSCAGRNTSRKIIGTAYSRHSKSEKDRQSLHLNHLKGRRGMERKSFFTFLDAHKKWSKFLSQVFKSRRVFCFDFLTILLFFFSPFFTEGKTLFFFVVTNLSISFFFYGQWEHTAVGRIIELFGWAHWPSMFGRAHI